MLDTELQKYIHISKYARWRDDLGRRETWEETVTRYVEFWRDRIIIGDSGKETTVDKATLVRIERAIRKGEVMPSMRALMTAGKALERDHIAGFNCTACAVTHPAVFAEAFFILMNGCGFGFSVERQYINQLPEVSEEFHESDTVIVVRDSKLGWAISLKELISMLYNGQIPKWDTSKVRPAGARLKTFGGRASGPQALETLFKHVIKVFTGAAGRKLTSIECHDILCYIAEAVIVGSVRRAAMISLSNLTDDRMRRAKDGQWWMINPQRAMANNSVAYTEKPDLDAFSKEWRTLYKSKSGERGIWNKVSAKKVAEECGREYEGSYLSNPCGETILRDNGGLCVSGDTLLITKNGLISIKDSIGKEIEIWNGKNWSVVSPFRTGSNQELYRVYLSDGTYIDVTDKHKWSVKTRFMKEWKQVETKDLSSFSDYVVQVEDTIIENTSNKHIFGDAYTLGFMVGDGTYYSDSNRDYTRMGLTLFGNKICCPVKGSRSPIYEKEGYNVDAVDVTEIREYHDWKLGQRIKYADGIDELFQYSRKSILEFFAGWIDADGSSTSSNGVRLYISGRKKAYKSLLLLKKNGINCSINLCYKKGDVTNYGTRSEDLYYIQITDCADIPCHRVDTSKGCKPKYKGKYQTIKRIEKLDGLHDTFCLEESERHMAVFGSVLTFQCNLSEVILRPDDSFATIKRKVEIATIIGTLQATLTDFRFLRKVWKNNAEEERLLGVSMTGIMDHRIFSNIASKEEFQEWSGGQADCLEDILDILHEHAHKVNKRWAKKLNINKTGHIGVVKPSGTVSILNDTSSGIHPRYGKYYIRRVRNDKKDPLSKLMIDEGVPYVEEGEKYVFSFYVKSPEHSIVQSEIGAIEQLRLWKIYKEHWCDGNPSQTIYYTDDDYFAIADWLWNNWDIVGGLSFFPVANDIYTNAPIEEITKEEYEKLSAEFPKKIHWERLIEYENTDETTGSQEVACSGGACEL